jgi:hypothetical protein
MPNRPAGKVFYMRMLSTLISPAGFPLILVIPAFLVVLLGLVGSAFVVMVPVVSVVMMVVGIVVGPLMFVLAPAVMLVGMLTVVTAKPTTASSTAAMTTATAGMTSTTAATMTSAPATPMTVGMNRRDVEAHNRQEDHSYHQRNRQ